MNAVLRRLVFILVYGCYISVLVWFCLKAPALPEPREFSIGIVISSPNGFIFFGSGATDWQEGDWMAARTPWWRRVRSLQL